MSEVHIQPEPMPNTHILVHGFDYHEPATLQEVFNLLEKYHGEAKIIAGGSHILPMLKMEREIPAGIVSIQKIAELAGIRPSEDGGLRIGANTTIREIRNYPEIQARYPALAEACASFGGSQVQIMGTLGGNVANGSPAADTVPALLVYEAEVLMQGPQGERKMPLNKFLLKPGKTALRADELLTAVLLPPPPENAVSTFIKVSRVAADLAKASSAALIVREGQHITLCRIAFGAVAPTVRRISEAEAVLTGQLFSEELVETAGKLVEEHVSPIDDPRSTAWYRRKVVNVMCQDMINMLWQASLQGIHGPLHDMGKFPPFKPPAIHNNHKSVKTDELTLVTLKVNGVKRSVWVASHELLLNVLREKLELTGAKYGCGLGECGACTVEMDGEPVFSCLVLAVSADGKEIVTVEGLEKPDGEMSPIQQSFVDEAAYQCGFCTPGFVLAVNGLLKELPQPKESEIRDYLKGNRCRCTGYTSIVRAVNLAVERISKEEK